MGQGKEKKINYFGLCLFLNCLFAVGNVSAMSSGGLELLTFKFSTMIIRSTTLDFSTFIATFGNLLL